MFTNPGTQFSPQDRPEPFPPMTSHYIFEDDRGAPKYLLYTLQSPDLGENCETDGRLAFPGTLDVAVKPAVSISLTADTESPSQMVAQGLERRNRLQMGRNPDPPGSEVFPDAGRMSPPMSSLTPPRHTRPLHHSIKLPELDGEEPPYQPQEIMLSPTESPIPALHPSPTAGKARWSPRADKIPAFELSLQINALGLYTDTPYLHDIVRRAIFDPSFSLHIFDPSVTQHLWDAAAGFDVRGLSIIFLESGTTVYIEPSMRNGGVVRVGDVLHVLKTAPAGSYTRNGTRAGVILKGYY